MLGFLARFWVVALIVAPFYALAGLALYQCSLPAEIEGLATPRCIVPPTPTLPWHSILWSMGFEIGPVGPRLAGLSAVMLALFAPFALAFLRWRRIGPIGWTAIVLLALACLGALGWLGMQPVWLGPDLAILAARIATFAYLGVFFVLAPMLSLFGRGRASDR